MTVQSTKNKISHVSLADQTDFNYDFLVLKEEDMVVAVNGVNYAQPYNVTGVGDDAGGVVQLSTPQLAGDSVVLYRLMDATQEIDYKKYDAFPAETHERGLDKLTLLIQQLNDFAIGSVRFPLAEASGPNPILPPAQDRALKFLFFTPDGSVSVSEGTSIGGEGVKTISIYPDGVSTELLSVDQSDGANPKIVVISPNEPRRLVRLDEFGKLPDSAIPGTIFEGLDVIPESIDMIKTDNADASNPAVGVKTPVNAPLSLIQLDSIGKIPPGLIDLSGFRALGVYRGDDLCDKFGDDPGTCIVPDYRNPSERFPSSEPNFRAGDYFIVSMIDGETTGSINLFEAAGDSVYTPVEVTAGDGILFLDDFYDEQDVLVLFRGWYYYKDLVTTSSAEFVAYDPTGNLIILPQDINVDLALSRLDGQALDRLAGGVVSAPISLATPPTDDAHLVNKLYSDQQDALVVQDLDDLELRVTFNESDIFDLEIEMDTKISNTDYAGATVAGVIKVRLDGTTCFISTTANNP